MLSRRDFTIPSCKAHLTLFLQSTTGGTVMPITARVLPGLNMLHCAHAPASSLQFVDGQELLSALLNSSPLFHLQFKNMCGHKCSQGVENKCLRRCKTMEKQWHGKLLWRTCRNNRNSCYFSPVTKISPTKRPPFWGPETDPKMEATHSVSI